MSSCTGFFSLIISRCQTFPSLWGLWGCYVDLDFWRISPVRFLAAKLRQLQWCLSSWHWCDSRRCHLPLWRVVLRAGVGICVACPSPWRSWTVMKTQVNQLCDTLGDRMAAWRKVFPFHKLQISKSRRNLGAVGDLHLIWDHLRHP